MFRKLHHHLVLALCLLASSCIDCREEYWIARDGSGRATIAYDLPASFLAMRGESALRDSVKAWISDHPQLTLGSFDISHANDRATIKASVSFRSALDLVSLATDGSLDDMSPTTKALVGHFDFRAHGRDVELCRSVRPSDALGGGLLVPESEIDGRRFVYTLHLPAAALSSNATRTEDGGKTLIWDNPLADGMKGPILMRFKTRMPIPWKWIYLGAGGAVLLAFLVRFYLRKRKLIAELKAHQALGPWLPPQE